MKTLLGLRVILTLFVAVLMPLELSHCAFMPLQAAAAEAVADHHEDGDHDCCPEPGATHQPASPSDACCCGNIQLPAATAPVSVSVDAPTSAPTLFVVPAMVAATANDPSVFVRLEPDARLGSPPDPSTAPQSPRSPPYSA
jgi:hypothetical protein